MSKNLITKYEQMIMDHTDEPLDRKTADAIEDVINSEYSITVTFEKGNSEETKTFSFKTQTEVEAFRDGVYEMWGYDDYKIEGED